MTDMRVLIIEDHQPTLEQLASVLAKEGYTVLTAADGRAGFALFEKENPEIIITDLKLPGLTGMQILEQVREKSDDVPVILITAFGETDTALQAIRLGALDYLKKPIDLDELLVALGRAKEYVTTQRQWQEFPTILLAEDDEISRRTLANVLRKEHFNLIEACNGEEALAVFQTKKIDIVLLDIKMPRMDGLTAFGKMRELTDDFEAIVLTGYGDESSAIRALRYGAMAFAKKPIDLDELLLTIEKAKQKCSLERSLRYRSREVALAQQIIARLVEQEDIVIHVSNRILDNACSQAANVLNLISDRIVILDRQLNVLFANRTVIDACEGEPLSLDAKLRTAFAGCIGETKGAMLEQTVGALFEGTVGTIKAQDCPNGDRLVMTTVNITRDNQATVYAVLIATSDNKQRPNGSS